MTTVKTLKGDIIELEVQPFASGGEGIIHKIISPKNYKDFCAKIYFDCTDPSRKTDKKIQEREDKVGFMVQNKPKTTEDKKWKICWPNELIYDENVFVGFIMPLAFNNSVELFQDWTSGKFEKCTDLIMAEEILLFLESL